MVVNKKCIYLQNYFTGQWTPECLGQLSKPRDTTIESIFQLYPVKDSELIRAKSALISIANQQLLQVFTAKDIANICQDMAERYLAKDEDILKAAQIAEIPVSQIVNSRLIAKKYLKYCAERILSGQNDTLNYAPTDNPATVILPGNSGEDVIYIWVAALLCRTPLLMRSSRRGAAHYFSSHLIKLFIDILASFSSRKYDAAMNWFQLVHYEHEDKLTLVTNVSFQGGKLVVFGSQQTLTQIERSLYKSSLNTQLIGMGTGYASSIVAKTASLEQASDELLASNILGGGRECICTQVVYVDEEVSEALKHKLVAKSKSLRLGPVEDPKTEVVLSWESVEILSVPRHEKIIDSAQPILKLKTFTSTKELEQMIVLDLQANGILKNIVTSLFTTEADIKKTYASIITKTHLFKVNQGTHRFDPRLPHQGIYLEHLLRSDSFYCLAI
jgi:hypothetical protein